MTKNYLTIFFRLFSLLLMVLASNSIQAQTTTWAGSWDNGEPDITKDVFFTSSYTSTADIIAKSVSVSNDAVVTIVGGLTPHTLTVENNISVTGALSRLILENNSSLVQINPSAVNSGNINYKRERIA